MQSKTGKPVKEGPERRNRMAERLRANLHRRKDQMRARVDAQEILDTPITTSDPSSAPTRKSPG